jgi:hypothetical protein
LERDGFMLLPCGKGGSALISSEGIDMITGEKILPGELNVGKYDYKIIKNLE